MQIIAIEPEDANLVKEPNNHKTTLSSNFVVPDIYPSKDLSLILWINRILGFAHVKKTKIISWKVYLSLLMWNTIIMGTTIISFLSFIIGFTSGHYSRGVNSRNRITVTIVLIVTVYLNAIAGMSVLFTLSHKGLLQISRKQRFFLTGVLSKYNHMLVIIIYTLILAAGTFQIVEDFVTDIGSPLCIFDVNNTKYDENLTDSMRYICCISSKLSNVGEFLAVIYTMGMPIFLSVWCCVIGKHFDNIFNRMLQENELAFKKEKLKEIFLDYCKVCDAVQSYNKTYGHLMAASLLGGIAAVTILGYMALKVNMMGYFYVYSGLAIGTLSLLVFLKGPVLLIEQVLLQILLYMVPNLQTMKQYFSNSRKKKPKKRKLLIKE